MALASLHRVTFSVLVVPFTNEFHLTMPQVGALQSAVLAGYMLGQIPAGAMADKYGGPKVMMVALALWCLATGATPWVQSLSAGALFAGLLVARASLGIAQSAIIPATSATVAEWVPEDHRSRSLTFIHACYNCGTVVALVLTPFLIQSLGWPAALRIFSAAGLSWAALARLAVRGRRSMPSVPGAVADQPAKAAGQPAATWGRLAFLCWSHIVISWGFFVFQSWIPTYLTYKGMSDLKLMGILSALPWGAAALVGLLVGNVADWLHVAKGWSLVNVRMAMQTAANIGPALSLLPLVVAEEALPIAMAVACLTAAVGLQGFCYAGFHGYVQDVAPADAGKVLGLTNACGTAVGIVANIIAGKLAAMPNGYSLLFASMAALYILASVTWVMLAKGEEVHFPAVLS